MSTRSVVNAGPPLLAWNLFLHLTIEKAIYGGDGLARLPADENGRGKAVFVPFVLEGEQAEVTLIDQKRGFARGRAEKILATSPHRVEPRCPYFARCGGCHYQHANYEHQLEIKAAILKENLRRLAKLELETELKIHPSPPWNYRNRARLKVQTSPGFGLGYRRFNSHELLGIEQCPISSPLINQAISSVRALGSDGKVPEEIEEIEFFANAEDAELLIEIYCARGVSKNAAKQVAEMLRQEVPARGIVAFTPSVQREGGEFQSTCLATAGENALTYRTALGSYQVSAAAFFQVNRHMTDPLVKIATDGQSGQVALDLYAGVGLFSTVLAKNFAQVIAVEASPTSYADLLYNSPSNVKAARATTGEFLKRSRAVRADLVVLDPPRSGLGESVVRGVVGLGTSRITYVSCDPATLSRDLVGLLGAGYRIEQAHLVDLFPQTYHLESVFHLRR